MFLVDGRRICSKPLSGPVRLPQLSGCAEWPKVRVNEWKRVSMTQKQVRIEKMQKI